MVFKNYLDPNITKNYKGANNMIFDSLIDLYTFKEAHLLPERIDTDFDSLTDSHFTDPHWVNDYVKDDGTFVHGYWRDGDGDTSHNHDKLHGGGYYAHDPGHSLNE
jgi:hypothetical protein